MIPDRIIKVIKNSSKAVVLPHLNADGDAIGSSIALCIALRKIGIEAYVCFEEEVPKTFSFLEPEVYSRVYNEYEENNGLAIALDTGDKERIGKRISLFDAAKITINIDHHITNKEFAQYNHVDAKSAATGEIIYSLIGDLNVDIDKDIAASLYVAISTDTGGFRYSNTTSTTHMIASELIKYGIDIAFISRRVFDTLSYEKTKLIGECINSLQLIYQDKIALIILPHDIAEYTGALEDEYDGIVNIGRNIEGVEVAVMMREKAPGEIKINLRSKEYINVAKIAEEFSGGGHERAAGCTIKGKLEEIEDILISRVIAAFFQEVI